jgi:hypothetical protein
VSAFKTDGARTKLIAALLALAGAAVLSSLLAGPEFGASGYSVENFANAFSVGGLFKGAARADGWSALALFLLIAAATFVSEDLTCVTAGVLAAEGRVGFPFAAAACLAGIFAGDLLLFLAGRRLGRAAIARSGSGGAARPSSCSAASRRARACRPTSRPGCSTRAS